MLEIIQRLWKYVRDRIVVSARKRREAALQSVPVKEEEISETRE